MVHGAGMTGTRRRRSLSRGWSGVIAGVLAAAVWGWTMGSAPRHSHGAEQDVGNFGACVLALAATAFIMGALAPRHATMIGVVTAGVPLLLAPSTAPRGDGDGLWVMVLPALALWCVVTVAVAWVGGWLPTVLSRWLKRCA